MKARLIALLAVVAVVLAGCAGAGGGTVATRPLGQSDINPQPRDKIRDGGTLRLPLDLLPSNFNPNQVDGSSGALGDIDMAVLPQLFTATADGGVKLNPDYLTSAAVTSTAPQTITYVINPKAAWSDGTPITWHDFQANWQALNGINPAYQVVSTTGYDDIASVARGADDKQVVVTFKQPFGEWQSLFYPLTPASLNATPAEFNSSWRTSSPVSAGPFAVQSIDQTAQTVTVSRDAKWWGNPAKLDHIIFKVFRDTRAVPDALANNELDVYGIASVDLLRRAQNTQGAVIRQATNRVSYNITFNGAAGSPLADLPLRQAVAQGINRGEIARRVLGQIVPHVQADGSHLYPPGAKEYQDNAGALPYDPAHAQQTLDSLGWTRPAPNAMRTRAGRPLSLRLAFAEDPTNLDMAKTVQNELAQLGVAVVLDQVDGTQFFPVYINRGNFDMGLFLWRSTPFPFSSSLGIYARPLGDNVRQNYGRIGTPEIDALFAQGNAELDEAKRAAIGNQVDRLIWQQAHSVILFATPGANAVRSTLANFGARGFADYDFIGAGFVK